MTGLLLVLLAGPATAADFQVENVKLDLGKFVLTIPKLDVKGSPLDRDAFLALFQAGGSESASSRIMRLSATEMSAPSIVMEQTLGSQKQVTTYKDIRFTDIREGRITRGEAGGGTVKVDDPVTGPMSGEIRRTSVDVLDLAHLVRVFSEKTAPGTTGEMKVVYGRIEQDGYSLDFGKLGKMALGKSMFRDFKARVGAEPLAEVFSRFAALSAEGEKASKDLNSKEDPKVTREREKQVLGATLAIFDAFDMGSGEMRDSTLSIMDPSKPGAKAEPVDLRMSRISFGEDTPDKSGFALEGLQFAGGGSKGSLDLMAYSGFSFAPVLQELRAALANPDTDVENYDWRKMMPQIGTVRLSGLQVEVPQGKPKGKSAGQPVQQPMRVGIGSFELRSGAQLNGIPTALTLMLDKLTIPVVESPNAPVAKDLLAMGYRSLDLSAKADLAWREADKQLAIKALSIGGVDMGQLDIVGTLGNVGKELFSADQALAQVAMLGATAKTLDVKLRNLGLFEKLIENEARKSKRKADDVRKEYAMMATLGLAAILGPSEGAKSLSAAVSRFVAKPGSLAVSATARAPGGLGLADVITLADPTQIFDKIDVKASAE